MALCQANMLERLHCPHPVGEPGALGFLAENGGRHVRVDGSHLLQNGLQNGVVAGVAPAVGTADHHAVPRGGAAAVTAENGGVDVKLRVHGLWMEKWEEAFS